VWATSLASIGFCINAINDLVYKEHQFVAENYLTDSFINYDSTIFPSEIIGGKPMTDLRPQDIYSGTEAIQGAIDGKGRDYSGELGGIYTRSSFTLPFS
jgi:hypothetical protein